MRLLSLVHDSVGEAPGVKLGHEAADLVALELEGAHAIVRDTIPVRGALDHVPRGGDTAQERAWRCGSCLRTSIRTATVSRGLLRAASAE
jgi:hypothetical protein